MKEPRKIVIVGATSVIAQHCARLWAAAGPVEFTLIGRDPTRLERVGHDLEARGEGCTARGELLDFCDPAAIQAAADRIMGNGPVAIVLIAHGNLPEQARCQEDLVYARDALMVNGVSTVLFAEAFARHMTTVSPGRLAVIGSVAGDRGRKSNYLYGASKGLVERYVQGLQHRFAATPLRVVLLKPGPTQTPMTMHLHANGAKLAAPEDVARRIVDGIAAGRPVVYAPARWRLIMLVIRHLPRFLFNRLNI